MSLFKRIFKVGQAEAHSAMDKLEDPIKLTEQGIRDLKKDLDGSLQGLAEVKAMAIRAKNDLKTFKNKADDYESKAMLLLQRSEKGEMDAKEADRLASEALVKKRENQEQMERSLKEKEKFEQSVAHLDVNVKKLRNEISGYENELKTLKARVKVSSATKNLNKQMSQIDSGSTISMLEKMKEKVAQEEALAESYGEIADESRSVDEEIDKALVDSTRSDAAGDLAALKEKMSKKKEGDQ